MFRHLIWSINKVTKKLLKCDNIVLFHKQVILQNIKAEINIYLNVEVRWKDRNCKT